MDFLHSIFPNIQHLGLWGYWLVFLVAFLESVVLVGSILPGSTLIVFAGFLSAHGYLDIGDLIWFAAVGAILGDGLSFYLGRQSTRFFRLENKIFKLKHLERGQVFFQKYGNKSILLARFIGPIRSIVPFIAGLFKMKKWLYIFWNVASAFLWAPAYLFLGYFFGGSLKAIEIWSTRFGIFLLFLFLLFLLIWILVKKSGPFFAFIRSTLIALKESLKRKPMVQRFTTNHPALIGFLSDRLNKNKFSGLPLTLLFIAFIYILSVFQGIIQDVINYQDIVSIDTSVANLLYSFRDLDLIKIFLWISLLLDWKMIIASVTVVSVLCWLWRRRGYLLPFWIVIGGAELFNFLGKLTIHRLRPEVAFYAETTFSFPSGHSTMAVALFGFGTYILFREIKNWKYKINILFFSVTLMLLMGLGRLYLGVHFLSDVWGGYLLGLLWLIIGISISELLVHRHVMRSSVIYTTRMKVVSAVILLAQLIFYFSIALHYHPALNLFKDESPLVISQDALTVFRNKNLPKYTETLFGKMHMPLNFMIIAKDDEQLILAMQKAGWHLADRADYASLAHLAESALLHERYPTAPMTPFFWNTKVQDLGFEKPINAQRFRHKHRARFWRTPLEAFSRGRVYVGLVSRDQSIKWLITHIVHPDIDTEHEYLLENLKATGLVLDYKKAPFVEPTKGAENTDIPFFTDGEIYQILLK
jgi:undecaprenyl-diphosphatase